MNDELTQLASAYLDGHVTADERARVESTPELLAEVERLRSVAALVANVEAPLISLREQQLAAALEAWDRVPETERRGTNRDITPQAIERGADAAVLAGAASITAPSRGDRRRFTLNRRLLGAAAALVVVLGGGIALQTLTSSSDDQESSDSATAESSAGAPEEASLAAAPENERASDEAASDLAGGGDGTTATDTTELDTGILDAAPPADRELEQLNNPEELGIFAADAVGAPTSPDVPAATSAPADDLPTDATESALETDWPLCLGADYVVGPARYRDVEVIVGIDESRDLALAYLSTGCREIARVRLP